MLAGETDLVKDKGMQSGLAVDLQSQEQEHTGCQQAAESGPSEGQRPGAPCRVPCASIPGDLGVCLEAGSQEVNV